GADGAELLLVEAEFFGDFGRYDPQVVAAQVIGRVKQTQKEPISSAAPAIARGMRRQRGIGAASLNVLGRNLMFHSRMGINRLGQPISPSTPVELFCSCDACVA